MFQQSEWNFSNNRARIVFFPGLGCDRRLGAIHDELPADVHWSRWLPMERNEAIGAYARRMSRATAVTPDCYLAGISLGGLVALEIARQIRPRGVILIGSMRSSAGVNRKIRRIVQSVLHRVPAPFHQFDLMPRQLAKRLVGLPREEDFELLRAMVNGQPRQDLKRQCQLAVSVPGPLEPDCPVFSIHGTQDRLLNYFEDETDVSLPNAGHLISLTHGREVNAAICRFLETEMVRRSVQIGTFPFALQSHA